MSREVMHRSASDNEYLHKDFHGALSCGIQYLEDHFGEDAVREYLHNFARSYYAPVRERVARDGLPAIREHLEKLYRDEGGDVTFESSDDELLVRVSACPAVTHMREHGYPVARLFSETTRSVNEALCEDTPFTAKLVEYDEQTGRSVQRFHRRSAS